MLKRWPDQRAWTNAEFTVIPRLCSQGRKSVVVLPCLIFPAARIAPVSNKIRSVTVVFPEVEDRMSNELGD